MTCAKCGGVPGAVAPKSPALHGFGSPAPCVCTVEANDRSMPSIEEVAALLFRYGGQEADYAKSRVLDEYAKEWAGVNGAPVWKALNTARELVEEFRAAATEQRIRELSQRDELGSEGRVL